MRGSKLFSKFWIIERVLKTSRIIQTNKTRNITRTVLKLQEEVGELSTEVNIKLGNLPKKAPGEDGIIGEACDVIIAALDVIYMVDNNIKTEDILKVMESKLNKWESYKN